MKTNEMREDCDGKTPQKCYLLCCWLLFGSGPENATPRKHQTLKDCPLLTLSTKPVPSHPVRRYSICQSSSPMPHLHTAWLTCTHCGSSSFIRNGRETSSSIRSSLSRSDIVWLSIERRAEPMVCKRNQMTQKKYRANVVVWLRSSSGSGRAIVIVAGVYVLG